MNAGALRRGFAPPVPQPPRANPFKANSLLARQYDAMLRAYAERNKDVVRADGSRCMGNGWACAFWRGYDSAIPSTVPHGTLAWACYRAGQAARLADARAAA